MKKASFISIVLLTTSLGLFIACEKWEDGWNVYTIKQEDHFSIPRDIETTGLSLYFDYKFDPSCLYDVEKTIPGWNKLYGFGDVNNHENSARLVWIPLGSTIKIGWYCYVDGVRNYGELDTVDVGKKVYGMVRWSGGFYQFRSGPHIYSYPQHEKPTYLSMKQYPYFGGQSTAPHEMKIYIKDY